MGRVVLTHDADFGKLAIQADEPYTEFCFCWGTAQPAEATVRILCKMLWHCHSTAALDLAAELLLAGVDRAATSIHFISSPFRAPAEGLSWISFHRGHVDRLLDLIRDPDDRSWGVRALVRLCEARTDLAGYVAAHARSARGLYRAALQYCISRGDSTILFESISELADMSPEQIRAEPLHLLGELELDWTGHEGLLIKLLKPRDAAVAIPLLENLTLYDDKDTRELDLGPVDWWIDWLVEKASPELEDEYFLDRVSWFLEKRLSADAQRTIVTRFDAAEPHVKRALSRSVLLRMSDLTSDDLSKKRSRS